MLYEYLEQLCKERGISISKLLGEIGTSKSAASRWKSKGYDPSNATKKRIADYFGISVQELETGQKEKPADQKADELTEDEKICPIVEKFYANSNKKLLEIHEKVFYNNYRVLLERTGARQLKTHCCRHTFATLMANAEVQPAIITATAGHEDYSTTLGYTHIKLAEKLKAVNRL